MIQKDRVMLIQFGSTPTKPGISRFLEKLRQVDTNNTLYQSWYTVTTTQKKKKLIIGVFKDRLMMFDQFCQMMELLASVPFFPTSLCQIFSRQRNFIVIKGDGSNL